MYFIFFFRFVESYRDFIMISETSVFRFIVIFKRMNVV